MGYPYQHANYGDYYQGDIFSKLFQTAKGAVGGFIRGGPVGAVAGGVKAALGGARKEIPPPATSIGAARGQVPATYPGAAPAPGFGGAMQRFMPGGASGYVAGPAGGCPPGYHRNKALVNYERAVAMGKNVQMPNVKNVCVKHRSMNALNVKALRRGIRRTGGAVGIMKTALAGSGYTFKRTGAPTKRKRRRH